MRNEERHLVELFFVDRDEHEKSPAKLWRVKEGVCETRVKGIQERFQSWHDISKLQLGLISEVYRFESGKQPAIVAKFPSEMRRLSRFLAPGENSFDSDGETLRRLFYGLVRVFRILAENDIHLIHCSPSDLYWDGENQCQLAGIGGTLPDGGILPQDRALWNIFAGDEELIVAPELLSGECASSLSALQQIGQLKKSASKLPEQSF